MARDRALAILPPLLIVGLLLAVWQLYANLSGIGNDVLPAPSRVLSVSWDNRGDLWDNTLPTLRATLLGFALAIAVGFALAVLVDSSAALRRALMPVLVSTQTLPIVAIAPLMVIWFGFGLTPKVLLVALVTFFPITVSFAEGFASSDPEAEALLRSMGASRARIFRSVRFPSALPFFFAGLRIAITYAVVAAIFAEYAGASEGLGIYMQNAKNSFRTDLVLAAVMVSALLTLALFALTYLVERVAIPWYRLSRKSAAVSAGATRLELRGLSKSFGSLEVLRDLSLEAHAGEFVAILGPSGCGKSTVFSILTGGTTADGGEILIDGASDGVPPGHFAYMPQSDALLPWRRLLDNATLGLEVRGVPRARGPRARAAAARDVRARRVRAGLPVPALRRHAAARRPAAHGRAGVRGDAARRALRRARCAHAHRDAALAGRGLGALPLDRRADHPRRAGGRLPGRPHLRALAAPGHRGRRARRPAPPPAHARGAGACAARSRASRAAAQRTVARKPSTASLNAAGCSHRQPWPPGASTQRESGSSSCNRRESLG